MWRLQKQAARAISKAFIAEPKPTKTKPKEPPKQDINTKIKDLCKNNKLQDALQILLRLKDTSSYLFFFQECTKKRALTEGKKLHTHITQTRNYIPTVSDGIALVNMYTKCNSLEDARQVFDKMPHRNSILWILMVSAYSREGMHSEALELFAKMQKLGLHGDCYVYPSVLPACGLAQGMEVHREIMVRGVGSDVTVANALIEMYGRCGNLVDACKVFDKMPSQNVMSWTCLIANCVHNGFYEDALGLFRDMQFEGVRPNNAVTAFHKESGVGKMVHEKFEGTPLNDNTLVMEGVGKMMNGKFEGTPLNDNTLASALPEKIKGTRPNDKTFGKLIHCTSPNDNTLVVALSACKELREENHGKTIHGKFIRCGTIGNEIVESALVDMYVKCGCLKEARRVFDRMRETKVVSLTSLISGYMACKKADMAYFLFRKFPDHDVKLGNVMVSGFCHNGNLDRAYEVFQEIRDKDVDLWVAIISGFVYHGKHLEALGLFREMKCSGVKNQVKTLVWALTASANMAALQQGEEIHGSVITCGFERDVAMLNGLIDMYGKCGSLDKAKEIFKMIPEPSIVSWTMMISAYGLHGHGKEAIKLFQKMVISGTKPDEIAMVCVLSACCHAGLVDEGRILFRNMRAWYRIRPTMEHFGCLIDLLGRAGLVEDALEIISKMPIKPDATIWCSLLSSCREYRNVEIGRIAAKQLFELDPTSPSPYLMLASIYSRAGLWDRVEKLRNIMAERNIKKDPGCSWIDVNKQMHAFVAGDESHPMSEDIYAELTRLAPEMRAAGYDPDLKVVTDDVDNEDKEKLVSHHSEKLAIAFGLISTPSGSPIRVIKNLRICWDCHNAIKSISKVAQREIIVRDTRRFHRFKDGTCSCHNFW